MCSGYPRNTLYCLHFRCWFVLVVTLNTLWEGQREMDSFSTLLSSCKPQEKLGSFTRLGKKNIYIFICLPRSGHPSCNIFTGENRTLAYSLVSESRQQNPRHPWSTRKAGQPPAWCRDPRLGLSTGLATE